MIEPIRLRLSRRKGFNLQDASRAANGLGAVIVARPSRWGNPFVIGRHGSREQCVSFYRDWLLHPAQQPLREAICAALRGRNLACWCPAEGPCHADALLAVANGRC